MNEDANLAADFFQPEPVEQEHDQERVTAIRVGGIWHDIAIGSLDLVFNDQGQVEFMADKLDLADPFISGKLSDITGLRSLPAEEEDEDGTES